MVENPLAAELRVVVGPRVLLYFTIRNVSPEPVELRFAGGQQFDFAVVERRSKRRVWRWAARRSFSSVPRAHRLDPQEGVTFLQQWDAAATGDYTASAWLTSDTHEAAATVELTVKARPRS